MPVLVAMLGASVIWAQDAVDWQTTAGGSMSFEVASVKPDTKPFRPPNFPLDSGEAYSVTGGRFSADFGLPTYISFAYKLSLTQEQRQAMVAHLPKWVAEDRFEIQAKATETNPTKDQMRLMVRSLLAERFRLAVHFETQDSTVFALVLVKPGKPGPKLLPHSEGPPCDAVSPDAFPPRCHLVAMTMNAGRMPKAGSRDTTMTLIADALPSLGRLGRPVVDRTGLTGMFDFAIEWAPETNGASALPGQPAPVTDGPSFQEALREQLGLKLESTRVPLQILVVDRVERPSQN